MTPRNDGEDNRILLISSTGCPPPNRGGAARIAALIVTMQRLGYAVHFAGIRLTDQEIASTRLLVDHWVGNFHRWPSPPLSMGGRIKRKIRSLLYRLEWVEDRLDGEFCQPWLEEARDLQRRCQYQRVFLAYLFYSKFLQDFPDPCLRIVDTNDIFANRRQRLRAQGIGDFWRSYSPRDEKRALLRAQRVIAIQHQEAAYFRQLLGSATTVYTVGHMAEALSAPLAPASFPRLGCIGSAHASNVAGLQWFLRDVWPRIRARVTEAEIWVAGSIGENCAPAPGLHLLGQVPSLTDFYRDCLVVINPVLAGTGISTKTIEALMHGRPVVSTRCGVMGLESFLGHGLLVGDSAGEFANAVVAWLSNLPQAQQAGEAALRQAQIYTGETQRALAQVLSK